MTFRAFVAPAAKEGEGPPELGGASVMTSDGSPLNHTKA